MQSDEEKWAVRLAGLMSKKDFSSFAEFLDGCDAIGFSGACSKIDEKNFPEKYGDFADESWNKELDDGDLADESWNKELDDEAEARRNL